MLYVRRRPLRSHLPLLAAALVVVIAAGLIAASAFATTTTGAVRSLDARSASCRAGFKPAIIGGNFKCLQAGRSCAARYQKAYRKYGFACVSGHLRKAVGVRATPPPSPPLLPLPQPPAQAGHYKDVTSQSETFEFDVTADGWAFRGLKTGQINEGCTPSFHIYWNYFDWPNYTVPVQADGGFVIDTPLVGGTVGPYPSTGHLTIKGHMSGPVGVGSLELTTEFIANGVAYSCGSGLQTWTVTRT